MRKFKITISKGDNWGICLKDFTGGWDTPNDKINDEFFNKFVMAESVIKNGEIIVLGEYTFNNKWLELAKNEPLMAEICEFTHIDTDSKKEIAKFQGTFIDALKYIQMHFKG
ncbi:MAG: hypothetical protein K5978_05315 [Campylobacter sp.]|nr:hypothetical protein [Campylobacter sp.]